MAAPRLATLDSMMLSLVAAFAFLGAPSTPTVADPIRPHVQTVGRRIPTLILTGQNRTDWRWTSTHLRELLEASGRFDVEISVVPEGDLSDPNYVSRFDLFLIDYSGIRWGEYAEKAFLEAIKSGTGLVALSDSVAAFDDWKAYEELIGFKRGDYAYLTNFQPIQVDLAGVQHPISAGLGARLFRQDQLPVGLELTAEDEHTVIATMQGMDGGNAQPAMLISQYGKGRVFASPIGHVASQRRETWASQRDPASEMLLLRICEWAATGKVTDLKRMAPNTLTAADRADGWKLLFDGASGAGWQHDGQVGLPQEGWRVEGGALHVRPTAGQGGIATDEAYREFELELEWKVDGEGAGVIDFSEGAGGSRQFSFGGGGEGANYILRPSGEWNHGRVVATYDSVEHWLNGVRFLTVYNDPAYWASRVSEGNLEQDAELSQLPLTSIVLRNEGVAVSMRNFKIRRLPLPMPAQTESRLAPITLFDGKNLSAWEWVDLSPRGSLPSAFEIDGEGNLINAGAPSGQLRTVDEYESFDLSLDWRFHPTSRISGGGPILLRSTGEDLLSPDALAVRLDYGAAGALNRHGGLELTAERRRTLGDMVRVISRRDNRPGDWNHLEIHLDGGDLVVRLNGEVVNAASAVSVRPGKIALVPMGTEIQYRGIVLKPLR